MSDNFHSAALTTESAVHRHDTNFKPDSWVIACWLTAGSLLIYPSAGRGGRSYKLATGQLRLPVGTTSLTVETLGATGFYSVYAVRRGHLFSIQPG
jgi:hypothetical protein